MFCTNFGTEAPDDSPLCGKCGSAWTRVLRFLWAILMRTCVCGMSQEIPSNVAHDSPSSPIVTWELAVAPQFFPAVILSTGSVSAKGTSQILCDPRSSFRIRVKSSTPATRIHVEVKVDGFFLDAGSCDATLENADQLYVVAPTPRWDMHRLAFNDQPVPATVVVNVKANGADLGQKTGRIQLRAVNDVPFAVKDDQGHITDRSNLFAAFVNENSPVVEIILKEAL
jgi:hypothetical protein